MSFIEAVREGIRVWRNPMPKADPNNSNAVMAYPLPAKVGKSSPELFRHWAEHSEFVRAAIKIRKSQVSQSDWDIVPFDPDIKKDNKRQAARLRELFRSPNPQDGDFRTFIERVVEDLLVLDAGCIEEVRGLGGQTVQLWPVDGAKVKVSRLWEGNPDQPRYFWYPDGFQETASWLNEDFVYLMQNPRTYTPVGLSPLETLKIVVESELAGMRYNRRNVEGAAPDGMLHLGEGIRPEKVEEFRSYWDDEIAGRGRMAITGGTKGPQFIDFKKSNRDMQFMDWQLYLANKIAVVFDVSRQDLGLVSDINRSTSEVLNQQSEDRGLRPLLGLIASAFTREIVWDDSFGGPDNNLCFKFTRLNLQETMTKAEINHMALAGLPWKSIDTARVEGGLEPLGGMYAKLMAMTPRGIVVLDDIPTAREAIESDASKPTSQPTAKLLPYGLLPYEEVERLLPGGDE